MFSNNYLPLLCGAQLGRSTTVPLLTVTALRSDSTNYSTALISLKLDCGTGVVMKVLVLLVLVGLTECRRVER